MKSILDPTFRYTPSVETDLRKTFARVRRETMKAQKQATPAADMSRIVALPRARLVAAQS